jgi:hypothetical protein
MAQNYGSGNNSFTAVNGIGSDNGYVRDATTYGARLDYSVAANLNVYGSFFRADRVSHSYGWGYIRPDPVDRGNVEYARQGDYNNPVPAIPDRNLGYEIGAGFDWQILEAFIISGAFAYWQPGRWFNYACRDRSVANWDNPTAANNWGINPARNIHPVFGMDVTIAAEF